MNIKKYDPLDWPIIVEIFNKVKPELRAWE